MQRHDFRGASAAQDSPHSLDALHADFAVRLSAALREVLSVEPQIVVARSDMTRYSDFAWSRSNPTCASVLHVDPPGAQICLDLSPHIAFPLIDRLLGGRGDISPEPPLRPLTQTERGLALQIIERAAAALADTWSSTATVTVREEGLFSDASQIRLMPPDEMVNVVTFHVSFNRFAGSMTLCLPAPVTELLGGTRKSMPPATGSNIQRDRDTENLTHNVMRSAIELRALLAETKLRLNEVLALQEGDIIITDTPADSHIPLRLHGQALLHGRLGQLHGHRAVQIAKPAGGQSPE